MERELLLSGIGGQGIQLAAKVLAHGAMADGREVQLFGSYGGMMRGGNTDTTLVVGDGRITTPPTVQQAWAAVVMHGEFAAPSLERVRAGGLVFTNADVVAEHQVAKLAPAVEEVRIPATGIAIDTGDILSAAMVMIGAVAAATSFVSIDAMCGAVEACLPPYRQQLAELNERAIRAGASAAPVGLPAAWDVEVRTA